MSVAARGYYELSQVPAVYRKRLELCRRSEIRIKCLLPKVPTICSDSAVIPTELWHIFHQAPSRFCIPTVPRELTRRLENLDGQPSFNMITTRARSQYEKCR